MHGFCFLLCRPCVAKKYKLDGLLMTGRCKVTKTFQISQQQQHKWLQMSNIVFRTMVLYDGDTK